MLGDAVNIGLIADLSAIPPGQLGGLDEDLSGPGVDSLSHGDSFIGGNDRDAVAHIFGNRKGHGDLTDPAVVACDAVGLRDGAFEGVVLHIPVLSPEGISRRAGGHDVDRVDARGPAEGDAVALTDGGHVNQVAQGPGTLPEVGFRRRGVVVDVGLHRDARGKEVTGGGEQIAPGTGVGHGNALEGDLLPDVGQDDDGEIAEGVGVERVEGDAGVPVDAGGPGAVQVHLEIFGWDQEDADGEAAGPTGNPKGVQRPGGWELSPGELAQPGADIGAGAASVAFPVRLRGTGEGIIDQGGQEVMEPDGEEVSEELHEISGRVRVENRDLHRRVVGEPHEKMERFVAHG